MVAESERWKNRRQTIDNDLAQMQQAAHYQRLWQDHGSDGHPRPAGGRRSTASSSNAMAPQYGSLDQTSEIEQARERTGYEPICLPRRVDPWDGLAYTFEEITERYQTIMSPTALTRLWQQMAHARDHWLI